jgi:7-cyano-7-deazaguanine synthase
MSDARADQGQHEAVVLLSGGLDSATVLGLARAAGVTCHALAVDYGQRHRHELVCAQRVASRLTCASFKIAKLDLRIFGGSALTADIAVPKDRSDAQMAGDIPITYVPNRNMLLIALAAAYAETLGAKQVHLGVNAVDYSGYPDCRPAFIASMEQSLNLSTAAGVKAFERGEKYFSLITPIIMMSKSQIIEAGVRAGVDYSLTHSCYDPAVCGDGEVRACGHCDSCQIRRAGFISAGVADPTVYA